MTEDSFVMTLKYLMRWWGPRSSNLESLVHPFITITPRSILIQYASNC